ncbi:MAG: succinylglutamate desuccinylase/aspartoacylase family protein [Vampirovibrio sp.]|nr:succinylglutamate desuccinylase/aspartoacylase family protein [Vampirovibrio sp.]
MTVFLSPSFQYNTLPSRTIRQSYLPGKFSIPSPNLIKGTDHIEFGKEANPTYQRILGRYSQGNPGPLVFVISGLHGNERAGFHAFDQLIKKLEASHVKFKGEIVGLSGNLAALNAKTDKPMRFLDVDMNRVFKPELIAKAEKMKASGKTHLLRKEEIEMLDLLETIHSMQQSHRQKWPESQTFVLDLHSTSASGAPLMLPFKSMLHKWLPATSITDKHDLDPHPKMNRGYLNDYLNLALPNCQAAVFEGGGHDGENTAKNMEAALWVLLAKSKSISALNLPTFALVNALKEQLKGRPKEVKVIDHIAINYPRGYKSIRKFESNLEKVKPNELIAMDGFREIRIPDIAGKDLYALMPNLQDKHNIKAGDDVVFLAESTGEKFGEQDLVADLAEPALLPDYAPAVRNLKAGKLQDTLKA